LSIDKFIGVPFKALGRTFAGCDCWGLVRLWYQDKLGIDLPMYASYASETDTEAISSIISRQKIHWTPVAKFEPGDVIVIRMAGKECHVGIYLSGNRLLHARSGVDSCIESLDHTRWRNRIAGGYRYE